MGGEIIVKQTINQSWFCKQNFKNWFKKQNKGRVGWVGVGVELGQDQIIAFRNEKRNVATGALK